MTTHNRPARRSKVSSAGKASKHPKSTVRAPQRRLLELQTLQGMRTIFGSARRHDAEVRGIAGISGSQLWALSEIAAAKGMSVNDLSERMALHQTTASNLINALVERKLIQRARDTLDQRVVRLHVTSEGKRALLRAPGPYAGLLVDALRRLNDAELKRVQKALASVANVMRNRVVDSAGQTLLGE